MSDSPASPGMDDFLAMRAALNRFARNVRYVRFTRNGTSVWMHVESVLPDGVTAYDPDVAGMPVLHVPATVPGFVLY